MKHVLTLDQDTFAEHCCRLEAAVRARDFMPDAVLGIITGGEAVAARMFVGVPHCGVCLQRPGTATKRGMAGRLLRRLPRGVNNMLRIAEAYMLGLRRSEPRKFNGELPPELAGARRILIVDDAVDSGATMQAIYAAVAATHPRAELHSCAITVTTRHPLMRPDTALYNNGTLIRFPWSQDA